MAKRQKYVGCTVVELPHEEQLAAARTAVEINPANRPKVDMLPSIVAACATCLIDLPTPEAGVSQPGLIAALTTKLWQPSGVDLGVSFMETTAADLRNRILEHANAWGEAANVRFRWSQSQGQIRISRGPGGYYSYLGTDCLHIPAGQQTMNLEAFTTKTPESEYRRVVRHEFGHALGFAHEHQRAEEVAKIDPVKATDYFLRTQGWSATTTKQQVLTPLDPASIRFTAPADERSVMCYELPGAITRDGKPIPGGTDIDALDRDLVGRLYPLAVTPTPPPAAALTVTLPADVKAGTYTLTRQ